MANGKNADSPYWIDIDAAVFHGRDGDVTLSAQTVAILRSLELRQNTVVYSSEFRYPCFYTRGFWTTTIHSVIAKARRADDVPYWERRGYDVNSITWHVAHLDDKRDNFNIENLMNVPDEVNRWCITSPRVVEVTRAKGTGYKKTVKVNNVKQVSRIVSTPAEAQHAHDCIKMFYIPERAREVIFRHGLLRPPEFSAFYADVDTLLQRAQSLYIPQTSRPWKKGRKSSLTVVAEPNNWDADINDAICDSDVPFDETRDAVIQYKGTSLAFQFLIERDDFDAYLKDRDDLNICKLNVGYVSVNAQLLHRLVLGLRTGEHARKGCHGGGGKMDNRKRTLRVDSHAGNMRDVKRKRTTSPSNERGVFRQKDLWLVKIKFGGKQTHCGSYDFHIDAVQAARALYAELDTLDKMEHAALYKRVGEITLPFRRDTAYGRAILRKHGVEIPDAR